MVENPLFQLHPGKGPGDENFPVGSFLVAPALRAHVAAFYAFARAADDVADDPRLAPEEKLRRLDAFEDTLRGRKTGGPGPAQARLVRESLAATGLGPGHACVSDTCGYLPTASICGRRDDRRRAARLGYGPSSFQGCGMRPKKG